MQRNTSEQRSAAEKEELKLDQCPHTINRGTQDVRHLLAKALERDASKLAGKENLETNVTVVKIQSGDDVSFAQWWNMYLSLFPDERDRLDEDTIRKKWADGKVDVILMRAGVTTENEMESVGMALANHSEAVPHVAYIPYLGTHENFQGRSVLTRAMKMYEKMMQEAGTEIILIDCEDPNRTSEFAASYAPLTEDEVKRKCERRMHFFMSRGGFEYITPANPQLWYRRPASDDPRQIQAYDILGFKLLGNENRYEQYFKYDSHGRRTHIRKEGYRVMFGDLHKGSSHAAKDVDERTLRGCPAINSFYTDLDASTDEWIELAQDPLAKIS